MQNASRPNRRLNRGGGPDSTLRQFLKGASAGFGRGATGPAFLQLSVRRGQLEHGGRPDGDA
jgi:hypothetical protein